MRNITETIWTDQWFGNLSCQHRLLWIGLLTIVDDQGRIEDNTAIMRARLFPYDDKLTTKDIEQGLALFAKSHKIDRYHVGSNGTGKQLIQVVNWWKYQKSTHWAGRSIYPAPEKWVDRIRTHDKGSTDIVQVNWHHIGGYVATMKELRNLSYVATTKPVRSDNEADKPETRNLKTRNQKPEIKNQPPYIPPSTTKQHLPTNGRKAGEKVEKESLSFDDLSPKQSKRAERAQKILASLGIRNPKLKTTSIILATRHFKTDEQMITQMLAAIASVYADINVKSKEAVILHRIENDSVPRSFIEDKKLWRSIPQETLAISGIEVNDHHDQMINKLRQRGKETND